MHEGSCRRRPRSATFVTITSPSTVTAVGRLGSFGKRSSTAASGADPPPPDVAPPDAIPPESIPAELFPALAGSEPASPPRPPLPPTSAGDLSPAAPATGGG